jgi:hypothetical protein
MPVWNRPRCKTMCHACHAPRLVDHWYKINVATLWCIVPRIHRDMSIALVVWAIEQVMRKYMNHWSACVVGHTSQWDMYDYWSVSAWDPNSPIENDSHIPHSFQHVTLHLPHHQLVSVLLFRYLTHFSAVINYYTTTYFLRCLCPMPREVYVLEKNIFSTLVISAFFAKCLRKFVLCLVFVPK